MSELGKKPSETRNPGRFRATRIEPYQEPARAATRALPLFHQRLSMNPQSFFSQRLAERDPAVAGAALKELERQQSQIELIASENIVSAAVLEAQGSVLTNKYAEGYPAKRYYGGCEHVDKVEALAIERVKALFGAEIAKVQPHSGAPANGAVMLALVQPV